MFVTVRLYATLQKAQPSYGAGEPFVFEMPEGTSVADLISALHIQANEVKAIRVNGQARADVYRLHADDEIDLFPPIGGG